MVLPACAQRHASSGGFAAHSAAPAHSGFSAPHSGFGGSAPARPAAPARFGVPHYGAPGPNRFAPNHRGGYPGRPGGPGNSGWHHGDRGDHHRRAYISPYRSVYVYPYYAAPWIGYGPGYFDDSDSSDYDNLQTAAGVNPENGDYLDQSGYGPQVPDTDPNSQGLRPWPARGPYAPHASEAQPYAGAPSAAPAAEQPSITLVFKDGRPSMQIRNYLLTQSTLYTGDGLRREIPLSDLDLAATADANRNSGVDFRLPQGQTH